MSKKEEEKVPSWPVIRALTNPTTILGVPSQLFLINIALLPVVSLFMVGSGLPFLLSIMLTMSAHFGLYLLAQWDPHAGTLVFAVFNQNWVMPFQRRWNLGS